MHDDLIRKLGLPNPIRRSSGDEPLPSTAVPHVRTASGLWLPRTPVDQSRKGNALSGIDRPAILEFSVTTIGWNDLTGQRANMDDVVARLGRYSLRELVGLVSRVAVALELDEDAFDRLPAGVFDTPYLRRQFWILQRLGGAELAARAMAAAKQRLDDQGADHGRVAFFQDRQTLNALKIGLLVLEVAKADSGKSSVAFLEALLMITDLIDPPEGTLSPDELELYVAANTLFNERPRTLPEWVRALTLFVEPRPEIANRGAVDVSAQLARATGIEARLAWIGLFTFHAFWGTLELTDLDQGKITATRKGYFGALPELPSSVRDAWLSLAIASIDDMQQRVRAYYALDNIRWFDVLPFEERPLIAFDDLVFCPSRWLLERLPGSSLQYRLLDDKVFELAERRRFLDTRGHLVEWYTLEAVRRAFGSVRVLDEASLQAAAPGEKVCDAIIVYPDALILLECKTFAVLLDTRRAENYAAYRKKWCDAVNKAADQFESTIGLLRAGAFNSIGIKPEMLGEIIPVIGVFEQPVTPLTYRAIRDRDLKNHPLTAMMGERGIRRFQLVDISEIESWERAAEHGRSVLELLRAKLADLEATELSFHHFVHLRGESFIQERTRWHAERWNAIADAASEQLHAYGLREPASEAEPTSTQT